MTGLLIAETHRFVSRRMTRFFPLVLAVLFVIATVIAYFVIQAEDGSIDFVGDIGSFARSGADGPVGAVDQPDHATAALGPLGFLLPIMAFTLGASFFGADQKSGVIELLLTWQPRRLRFLGVRAIGGAVVTAFIGMALSAFFVAAMYTLSSVAGTTDGMTGQMWTWIASAVLRSGLVAGLFFVLGLGLTVLFNNSIASIVSFLIYVFVIEGLMQAFLDRVAPWLPMGNAQSFVDGTNVLIVDVFGDSVPEVHHGYLLSGLLVLLYAVVAFAIGLLVFNRRDIA